MSNHSKVEEKLEHEKHILNQTICQHSNKCEVCAATKKNLKSQDIEFLLDAHHKVKESGKFNFQECRIPVNDKRTMMVLYRSTEHICNLYGLSRAGY